MWALAGWVAAGLGIFLNAGDAVLHGRTPYQDVDEIGHHLGYVYPPLLAFVDHSALGPARTVAGDASGRCSYRIFSSPGRCGCSGSVRDWRCYPVALLWPFTREAVEYGAIGPLLLLIVAFLWRYRDSTWGAATATASAVAAKLFLWPLAVWLAFTGRIRTAGLSIAITLVLVFVPWIAIGLRRTEAVPGACSRRSRISRITARTASSRSSARSAAPRSSRRFSPCCCGVALLALAFRAARNHGLTARDRDRISLGYVLAAALVLTPVVWPHYLVLLLAPLALARPRLSALWLFVLAATVL